jgi:cytochrome P450
VLESNTLTSKGKEYSILEPWLGTGLLTSSGSKWKHRRKLLTPAFHFNTLNSFMLIHDQEAQVFKNLFKKIYFLRFLSNN